jgi:hypothetical protein
MNPAYMSKLKYISLHLIRKRFILPVKTVSDNIKVLFVRRCLLFVYDFNQSFNVPNFFFMKIHNISFHTNSSGGRKVVLLGGVDGRT